MAQKNDLQTEISAALRAYADTSFEDLKEIAQQVAKEGAVKLKKTSPRGAGTKKGHYADGWTVTALHKGAGRFSFVINNKKKPGLTQLLENGHQLRQGGRARAIKHIKPVEEWCNEEFERRAVKKTRDG